MENHTKTGTRADVDRILKELEYSTNSELLFVLEFLNQDFEETKRAIIDLTRHIDNVEVVYDRVLKEYNSRQYGGYIKQ